MKKTVTIQEAIKANEHSRVRRVDSIDWFDIGRLKNVNFYLKEVLADWEVEEKPLEIWINIHEGNLYSYHTTKESADRCCFDGRIRCVKMREVDDVEGVG